MADRVLTALSEASDGGKLPVVCDASSCTEGLTVLSAGRSTVHGSLTVVDATTFALERFLPALPPRRRVRSLAVHRTCSTTALGADPALLALARAVAEDVLDPDDWGCCAFAGDRGMLHPELTASATRAEAREVLRDEHVEYVSANRTCEVGMTGATGRPYRHILEVLERSVTR